MPVPWTISSTNAVFDVEDLGELAHRVAEIGQERRWGDPERAAGEPILQLAQPAVADGGVALRQHAAHRHDHPIDRVVVGVRGAGQLAEHPGAVAVAQPADRERDAVGAVGRVGELAHGPPDLGEIVFVDEVEVAGTGEGVGLERRAAG